MTTGDFGTLCQQRACDLVNLTSGRLKLEGVSYPHGDLGQGCTPSVAYGPGQTLADDAWAINARWCGYSPVLGWQYYYEILE